MVDQAGPHPNPLPEGEGAHRRLPFSHREKVAAQAGRMRGRRRFGQSPSWSSLARRYHNVGRRLSASRHFLDPRRSVPRARSAELIRRLKIVSETFEDMDPNIAPVEPIAWDIK